MQRVGNWKNFFDISFLKEIVRLSEEGKIFSIQENENGLLFIEETNFQSFDDGAPYSKKEERPDSSEATYFWTNQEGKEFRESGLPTSISVNKSPSCKLTFTFYWRTERKNNLPFMMNSDGTGIFVVNEKFFIWNEHGISFVSYKEMQLNSLLGLPREEIDKIIAGAV